MDITSPYDIDFSRIGYHYGEDDFPKEIYFITKNKKRREEAAGREDMRGSNIEIFTANNNFPSSSVCKRRII